MSKKIFVIIPAFNESKILDKLIPEVNASIEADIVLVNDGSSDNTSEVALKYGVTVLEHSINRGAGAATFTGILYALEKGAEYIVTLDGDGQHSPSDITNVLKPVLEDNFDISIGSRMIDRKNMPMIRKLFNLIGNLVTFVLFGIYLNDTQSGFKAFTKKTAELVNVESDGYEFCSEFIREIKRNKLKYIEVPIKTIYTEYSLSKGQDFSKGVAILFRLFFGK